MPLTFHTAILFVRPLPPTPLKLFQLFLLEQTVQKWTDYTNDPANFPEDHQGQWKATTAGESYIWAGITTYMSLYTEKRFEDYRRAPETHTNLRNAFPEPSNPPNHIAYTEGDHQDDTAAEFQSWLEELPALTLIVYSDGSQTKDGAFGHGFTVHRGGKAITRGSDRLGPAEVFDAEATGALEGFKAALSIQDSSEQTIIVCLDNIAAATCLRGKPSDSSQDIFIEFQALAASHGDTKIRWVPGLAKILGNEEADAPAKPGCLKPVPAGARRSPACTSLSSTPLAASSLLTTLTLTIYVIDSADDAYEVVYTVRVSPAGCGPRHGVFYPPGEGTRATHYFVVCEPANLIM
ncbi:hypothetical protein S40285_09111, partial [Stachybotrys chlorohalonatus IBT 40285]